MWKSLSRYNCWALLFLVTFMFFSGCQKKSQEGRAQVTLRYAGMGTGAGQEIIFKELGKLREKTLPHIRVKEEYIPRDYFQKIQVQLASGTAPDIFVVTANFPKLAKYGVIMDIDRFIASDKEFSLDDYCPQAVEPFRYKGKLYGISNGLYIIALYYNKDMFDEAGLSYPDSSWTWDDLLSNARKLTKDTDGDGKIDQWGYLSSLSLQSYLVNFVRQAGGEVLNEERTKCLMDQPEAVEAVQFLVDLVNKYKVSPVPGQTREMGDMFKTGRIAMINDGSWQMPIYREIKTFKWGVAPLPKYRRRATCGIGGPGAIYSKTKYPEEAWEYVKFLISPEAQKLGAKTGQYVPSLKSLAEYFVGNDEFSDYKKVFVDLMEYSYGLYYTENWSEWVTALHRELELAMLGKKTVEEACKEATEEVNKLLLEIH